MYRAKECYDIVDCVAADLSIAIPPIRAAGWAALEDFGWQAVEELCGLASWCAGKDRGSPLQDLQTSERFGWLSSAFGAGCREQATRCCLSSRRHASSRGLCGFPGCARSLTLEWSEIPVMRSCIDSSLEGFGLGRHRRESSPQASDRLEYCFAARADRASGDLTHDRPSDIPAIVGASAACACSDSAAVRSTRKSKATRSIGDSGCGRA